MRRKIPKRCEFVKKVCVSETMRQKLDELPYRLFEGDAVYVSVATS